MLLLLFIPIFPSSFGDQTDNKTTNDSQNSFSVSTIITTIVLTPTAGAIGYLLKRHFVKNDLKFQQNIVHENWLYEQFYPLALDYYVPLAKLSFDAVNSIARAVAAPNNEISITMAYFNINLFLSKYTDFKNSKGANFLFKTRKLEQEAITATSAILSCLPFNDLDVAKIHENMQKYSKKIPTQFHGHEYDVFRNWLTSGNCPLSINLVMRKLDYLQQILDTGGEEIAHPELFNDNDEVIKIIPPMPEDDIFYLLSSTTKYTGRGDTIAVIGEGFTHQRVTYRFFLGGNELNIVEKTNNFIRLQIPNDINVGIYDIFARFSVSRFGGTDTADTIGIPITITN
jgi:hypothetical protein